MNLVTYYHGTEQADAVLNAIVGSGQIRQGFHLTHDIAVAKAYGSKVVKVELEADFAAARVTMINKEGNFNPVTGNSVETVLDTPAAVNELYANLWDAELVA